MTNQIGWTVALACVLSAAGCAHKKKDDGKVKLEPGVTDVTPTKSVPSSVPPDPSFVSVPAASSQPKFVPVDAPSPDPLGGIAAAPAPAAAPASYAAAPVVTSTPVAPAAPAPTLNAAKPGGGKPYLVQKGDTLFRIAKTHYGNGNRWQQIAMVNPGLTPATLKAGSTIVVP